jgi:adenylate cyclase
MREALDTYRSWGTHLTQTCYVANLAELDPKAGRRLLEEARAAAEINGELFWMSEIHRLFGETALTGNGTARSAQEEAERRFLRSLEISQASRCKALELRAAASLARLRLRQGRREEGRELLAGVYGWFTEGFDTADLREARELLAELHQ